MVNPSGSPLHVMENPSAKPDLGDDVGDDAAFAAVAAIDALHLPKTPPPLAPDVLGS